MTELKNLDLNNDADAQRVVADLQKQVERCKADTSGSNCAS